MALARWKFPRSRPRWLFVGWEVLTPSGGVAWFWRKSAALEYMIEHQGVRGEGLYALRQVRAFWTWPEHRPRAG